MVGHRRHAVSRRPGERHHGRRQTHSAAPLQSLLAQRLPNLLFGLHRNGCRAFFFRCVTQSSSEAGALAQLTRYHCFNAATSDSANGCLQTGNQFLRDDSFLIENSRHCSLILTFQNAHTKSPTGGCGAVHLPHAALIALCAKEVKISSTTWCYLFVTFQKRQKATAIKSMPLMALEAES